MLKITVLEKSAEARAKITDFINRHLHAPQAETALLPRMDIKPLSPEEVRYHAAPDICIVGHSLLNSEPGELSTLRKILPQAAIIVYSNTALATFSQVEHLARLGADEVVTEEISTEDFLRKLIMLSKKSRKARAGQLILVDSAKGGVGATSVSAALAEALVEAGKKVTLVDLDFESQDLSRFMRARPFINENLAMLLEQHRPVTEELVEQCLIQVWHDEPNLLCMPPVPDTDNLYASSSNQARILVNVLEILDGLSDAIVIDVACARGAILQTLYRVADYVLFVVGNDPAALFASVDRSSRMRSYLAPDSKMLFIENSISPKGLQTAALSAEFLSAAKFEQEAWLEASIPFCQYGQRWPASGGTLFSQSKGKLANSINQILVGFGFIEQQLVDSSKSSWSFFDLKLDRLGALVKGVTGTNNQLNLRDALLDAPTDRLAIAAEERKLIEFNPESLVKTDSKQQIIATGAAKNNSATADYGVLDPALSSETDQLEVISKPLLEQGLVASKAIKTDSEASLLVSSPQFEV